MTRITARKQAKNEHTHVAAQELNVANVRVLLADDHMMVAEAFKKLLEPEFEVVGIASDGRKLLQLALQTGPDVVLLDLGMPLLNGFDAGRQLKKLLPATKIVVVTINEDIDTADAALREFASGYLFKSSASRAELSRAIATVMTGNQYVSPRIADRLLQRFIRDPRRQARPLTYRQREVLQLLAEGRSMKQAAAELNVSTRTIAFHKYRIMDENGLKSNAALLVFAIKEQVVPTDLKSPAQTSSGHRNEIRDSQLPNAAMKDADSIQQRKKGNDSRSCTVESADGSKSTRSKASCGVA